MYVCYTDSVPATQSVAPAVLAAGAVFAYK